MVGRLLVGLVVAVGAASIILWAADFIARTFKVAVLDSALNGVGGWLAIAAKVLGMISLNLKNRPQL
jgi:hypothetical protein